MLQRTSDTQAAAMASRPSQDTIGRVLRHAPQRAALELDLPTVLVSRVYDDGAWRPWSATGVDIIRVPDFVTWPAFGADPSPEQHRSPDDEMHPLVRRALALNWLLAPITAEDHVVGFFHAEQPGPHSRPFFRSCDRDLWNRLLTLGTALFPCARP